MKTIALVFSTLLLSVSHSIAVKAESISTIREKGELRICVHRDALPFSAMEGADRGMHIDLAELLAKELKVSLKLSWVSFRYQAKYVKCDAFMGVGIIGEEDEGFLKKTDPYAQIEILAITNPNRQLKSIDDLEGLRVATVSSSLVHSVLVKKDVELFVSYLRDSDIIEAVMNGDVDVGIVANSGWGWYKKLNSQAEVDLQSQSTEFIHPFNGYPMTIGFRKADEATVTEVNQILDRIRERGELAKLLDKYGLEPIE